MIVPRKLVARWFGIFDAHGEVSDGARHSDLIFDLPGCGVAKFEGAEVFGEASDAGACFHPTPTGGLLLSSDGAAPLAAALSIPDAMWTRIKARWTVADPDLVMFGHRLDGRRLKKGEHVRVRLAKGTYAIDVCDGFEAEVRVGRAAEDVELSVIRFTKR